MPSIENWKTCFTDWPAAFPKGGILVTMLNEVVPFRRFWIKGELLLLERTLPDASGGRYLMLNFDVINSVKFVIPLSDAAITDAGFVVCGDEGLLQTV